MRFSESEGGFDFLLMHSNFSVERRLKRPPSSPMLRKHELMNLPFKSMT